MYTLHNKTIFFCMHACCSFSPVPEPSSVTVSRSPEMIYAGSNFTLKCNITLSMNVEEVLGSLEIYVKWSGLGIGMIGSEVKKPASLMCSTSILINSANHSHDGNYTCDAKVRAINSPYLVTSSKTSKSVEITISMLIALPLILLYDIVLYSS